MIDKQSIGKRFKSIRKYLKLNQTDFSDAIEVSQQTISQIENGSIAPSLEIINKITSNYSIYYSWLIDGEEPMLKGEIKEVLPVVTNPPPEITEYLKQQIKEKDTRIEDLKEEIGSLKKEVHNLKSRLQQANIVIPTLL
jgi:transcriptional regulator with XRE-family HTH domain